MGIEGTEKLFKTFLEKRDAQWDFGNRILYEMCEKEPCHKQTGIIVGKMWLIGRSYAAAIERRKSPDNKEGDFYLEVVAPKMLSIGTELDDRLTRLKSCNGIIGENIEDVLETHKFLMDAFYEMTKLEKRSLASKHLHFHCPDMFFLYDSRAKKGINYYVKRPDKSILKDRKEEIDEKYGDFVCRMLKLQTYLTDKMGTCPSPRLLDSFLLQTDKGDNS